MNFKQFKLMLQLLQKSSDAAHNLRMALYRKIKDTLTYTDMWELARNPIKGHYFEHPLYAGLKSIYEEQNNDKESKKKT